MEGWVNLALVTVTVEIDDKLVKEAEVILAKLGIDVETAINLFLREVVFLQKLPFNITPHRE